jgi:conjugal transfer pilus assembly protein TraD
VRPAPRSSPARRYFSLALWAAVLMAPSVTVAAGLIVGGALLMLGPALARAIGRVRQAPRVDRGAEVVLGRDAAGRTVSLNDGQLAAHALILGASGSGKTTTLLGILGAQIRAGRPVIAIDMKGSPAFAAELRRVATAAGRRLRVWTPDGGSHWNPLAHGNATALKDKLISTEQFSEPHYQRAAERYVQTTLQVLHAAYPGRPARLDEVVALMEPKRLASVLRQVPRPLAERVQDYLAGLTRDQVSAARGLGTRLALLSESCAGPYLVPESPGGPGGRGGTTIDLRAGLEGGDVILLSLNSSVYGKLAAQLGALALQDLVSAAGDRLGRDGEPGSGPAATVAIDEFSALGADNVLALLARGRESGVSIVTVTQEMADLERAAPGFRDQVLGIIGVKIAHRQDVPASAEMIAQMAGTERVWEPTLQMRGMFAPAGSGRGRGTKRQVEQYLVHPNEIKTLAVGEAVILTKLPTAQVQRVRIDALRPAPAGLGPTQAPKLGGRPGPPLEPPPPRAGGRPAPGRGEPSQRRFHPVRGRPRPGPAPPDR